MKRIATTLLTLLMLTLTAQHNYAQENMGLSARMALDNPKSVSHNQIIPRSGFLCYASREEMDAAEGSSLVIPLTSWQTDSLDHGVRYTARFKRNYRFDDKEIVLRVEGATGAISIEVNDKEIGYTSSGIGRSEFDLTKHLKENHNTISITVHRDYAARTIEPYNKDGLKFQRASLLTPPRVAIADFVASTKFNSKGDGLLNLGVVMQSFLLNSKDYTIYYELYDPDGVMVTSANKELTTRMRSRDTVNFFARIPAVKKWSLEEPNLYRLVVYTRHEKRIKEFTTTQIGFRTVEVGDEGLLLNGEKVAIKSKTLSHYSPEKSLKELTGLKKQGYTIIHTPRPQLDEFYTLCDQVGLMVCCSADINCEGRTMDNTPSNNPEWKENYIWRAKTMYHTTRLHPSLVMFSIANNAQNGICLYESYLAMKALKNESRPIVYPDADGEWNTDL